MLDRDLMNAHTATRPSTRQPPRLSASGSSAPTRFGALNIIAASGHEGKWTLQEFAPPANDHWSNDAVSILAQQVLQEHIAKPLRTVQPQQAGSPDLGPF